MTKPTATGVALLLSDVVVSEATVRANVGILARFVGVSHAVAVRNPGSILRFAVLKGLLAHVPYRGASGAPAT